MFAHKIFIKVLNSFVKLVSVIKLSVVFFIRIVFVIIYYRFKS